jgi:hypothetical protein
MRWKSNLSGGEVERSEANDRGFRMRYPLPNYSIGMRASGRELLGLCGSGGLIALGSLSG